MSGFDFEAALDTKANEVEKPPVLPQGNYIWSVKKIPAISVTKTGEWTVVEFQVTAISAEEDVDPGDLTDFGALSSAMNRVSFMAPTDPEKEADVKRMMFRLKNFLQKTLRVDCEEDATIREMLDSCVHCQFFATATWKPSPDGEDTYVELKNYAPLD